MFLVIKQGFLNGREKTSFGVIIEDGDPDKEIEKAEKKFLDAGFVSIGDHLLKNGSEYVKISVEK